MHLVISNVFIEYPTQCEVWVTLKAICKLSIKTNNKMSIKSSNKVSIRGSIKAVNIDVNLLFVTAQLNINLKQLKLV